MVKESEIGGIYNKPIAVGNFMHFGIGALALVKSISNIHSEIFISLTVVYVVFAILFGYVFRNNPSEIKQKT